MISREAQGSRVVEADVEDLRTLAGLFARRAHIAQAAPAKGRFSYPDF